MRLQFSNKRIIPDAVTVWFEPGPQVDLVMDIKKPTFADGTIERLYVFHALDRLAPSEAAAAVAAWRKMLVPKAKTFIVTNDLEFLARSLIGGDLSIGHFNDLFIGSSYFTRDLIVELVHGAGFANETMTLWYADVTGEFPKAQFELVISADNV